MRGKAGKALQGLATAAVIALIDAKLMSAKQFEDLIEALQLKAEEEVHNPDGLGEAAGRQWMRTLNEVRGVVQQFTRHPPANPWAAPT